MSRIACRTCRAWARGKAYPTTGECRRYAPRPLVAHAADLDNWSWCVTLEEDWCTEYLAPLPPPPDERLKTTLIALGLSGRARRAIYRATGYPGHAITLGDLVGLTAHEIRIQKNCGRVTLGEIRAKLAEFGLKLTGG